MCKFWINLILSLNITFILKHITYFTKNLEVMLRTRWARPVLSPFECATYLPLEGEAPKEDVSRHHNPLSIVFARCYLWRTTLFPSSSHPRVSIYLSRSRSLPSCNAVANKLRFKRLFIRLFMERYSCAVLVWRTFSAPAAVFGFFVSLIDLWHSGARTMGWDALGCIRLAMFDSWGHVY